MTEERDIHERGAYKNPSFGACVVRSSSKVFAAAASRLSRRKNISQHLQI